MHRGSSLPLPKGPVVGTFTTKSGTSIPIVGTIGTNDPDVWAVVLWFDGKAYARKMLCDVIGHVNPPEFRIEAARANFERYPEQWTPVHAGAL